MTRWSRFKSLAPLAQGFLGALLCVALVGAGIWAYREWATWVVVKQVVGQIIENSNRERAKQEASKPQVEKP